MNGKELRFRPDDGGQAGGGPEERELGAQELEPVAGGTNSDLCMGCGRKPRKPGYMLCKECDLKYGV
jgi:hypothetical protein